MVTVQTIRHLKGDAKHPLNYCKVFPPLGWELIIPLKSLLVWNIFGLKKMMNVQLANAAQWECARMWSVRDHP